jgi:mannose-6-phosphate isomerase-like protein (cupin superfamily)
MNAANTGYVLGEGQGRSQARYIGGAVRVLVGADDSEGALSVLEVEVGKGGPPLHVHTHRNELLLVVRGVLRVRLGDETREAPAGSAVWIPKGVPHAFANESKTAARIIGVCTPGGLEKSLTAHADYVATLVPGATPDPERLAAIAAEFDGGQVVGPPLDVSSQDLP